MHLKIALVFLSFWLEILKSQGSDELFDEKPGATVESFFASGSQSFFSNRDAETVFQPTPVFQANFVQGEFENKKRLTLLEKQKLEREKQKSSQDKADSKRLDSRQAIIKEFGDPALLGKTVALESLSPQSPPALKGMVAALNLGDMELAKQYAKAYSEGSETLMKYFKTLTTVMETSKAAKSGIFSGQVWDNLDEKTKKELAAPFAQTANLTKEEIIQKLNEIVKERENEEAMLLEQSNSLALAKYVLNSQNFEDHRRLAEKVLLDSGLNREGGFTIFVFLDPGSKQSKDLFSVVTAFQQTEAKNFAKVNWVCMSVCSSADFVSIDSQVNLLGKQFADALWNESVPGLILIGERSGRVIKLYDASAEFLRHLIIKGAK